MPTEEITTKELFEKQKNWRLWGDSDGIAKRANAGGHMANGETKKVSKSLYNKKTIWRLWDDSDATTKRAGALEVTWPLAGRQA